jgi:hypothetical protein
LNFSGQKTVRVPVSPAYYPFHFQFASVESTRSTAATIFFTWNHILASHVTGTAVRLRALRSSYEFDGFRRLV